MNKILSQFFVVSLMVTLSVLVMEYGWGLKPQSWWWIIGGGVFANTALTALYQAVTKDK